VRFLATSVFREKIQFGVQQWMLKLVSLEALAASQALNTKFGAQQYRVKLINNVTSFRRLFCRLLFSLQYMRAQIRAKCGSLQSVSSAREADLHC
jgi:hypothetical protein